MRNESIQCKRYCETNGRCLVEDIEKDLFDDEGAYVLTKVFKDTHAKRFRNYVETETERIDEIEDRLYDLESTEEGNDFLKDKLVDELNYSLSPVEQRYTKLDLDDSDTDPRPFVWKSDFRCAKDVITPLVISSTVRGNGHITTGVTVAGNFR